MISKFLERTLNIIFEIIFYVGILAAPFGVKHFLQNDWTFLPEFIQNAIFYAFIFFFSCIEIYTHHRDKELESENNRYRDELKKTENIADNYRMKYEKLLREKKETGYRAELEEQQKKGDGSSASDGSGAKMA